jgi:hypothetical protein
MAPLNSIATDTLRDASASPPEVIEYLDDFALHCQAATARKVNFQRKNP